MSHSTQLRRLADRIHNDPDAAVFVVGWWAASASEEALDHLLELLDELALLRGPGGLPELLRERYGPVLDRRY